MVERLPAAAVHDPRCDGVMRRSQRGGASLEWLSVVLLVAVLVVAITPTLRGALDPRGPIRDALRSVGLIAEVPPRPANPLAGRPGDPVIGRALKGAGRWGLRTGAAEARGAVEEARFVAGVSGRLGQAFADGFRDELLDQVRNLALPANVREAAAAAIGGLWAKTPHAQAVRWGMSGGRVVLATVAGRSATAGARAAGREAAMRVVSYLVGSVTKRVGGISRESPAPGAPAPGPLSTGGFRPPVVTS